MILDIANFNQTAKHVINKKVTMPARLVSALLLGIWEIKTSLVSLRISIMINDIPAATTKRSRQR